MGQGPRDAEAYAEQASWFATAATFRREDRLEIVAGDTSREKHVIDHGHWIPNEDGRALVQAQWPAIMHPYREEDFVYWHNRWMPSRAAGD